MVLEPLDVRVSVGEGEVLPSRVADAGTAVEGVPLERVEDATRDAVDDKVPENGIVPVRGAAPEGVPDAVTEDRADDAGERVADALNVPDTAIGGGGEGETVARADEVGVDEELDATEIIWLGVPVTDDPTLEVTDCVATCEKEDVSDADWLLDDEGVASAEAVIDAELEAATSFATAGLPLDD